MYPPKEKLAGKSFAEQRKLKCTLSLLNIKKKVNVPYDNKKEFLFSCLSASEKCEAIEEFLEDNLRFDDLIENRIIDEHFHLHKATVVEDIQESYDRNSWRLTFHFMSFGNSWIRYL